MNWRTKAIDYEQDVLITHSNQWFTFDPKHHKVDNSLMLEIYDGVIVNNNMDSFVIIPDNKKTYDYYGYVDGYDTTQIIRRFSILAKLKRLQKALKTAPINNIVILALYECGEGTNKILRLAYCFT